MDPPKSEKELGLLVRVAHHLDHLGPFAPDTRREDKWRTTEQIANELGMFDQVDHLDSVLQKYEAECFELLRIGRSPEALIRRAKYPDRTTALPLWGSVKHHGEPWVGNEPNRSDPPEDIPASLSVPEKAPNVFLSHTHQDADLALGLAEKLAKMEIRSWRFETHIDQRGDIAKCVRDAIGEAGCLVALVTRWSIASLWVLTELHTALQTGVTVVLVINTNDELLLRLFQSVQFPNPYEDLDLRVEYDRDIVDQLKPDFGLPEEAGRDERYRDQVRDFLATLPSYLGSMQTGTKEKILRPAFAFPHLPDKWSGFIKLTHLNEMPNIL